MSSACLAIHWFISPPLAGMRTIGVTAGESDCRSNSWRRFSMYCRQSRSPRMSYGLCSASNTTPSYLAVASSMALSIAGGEKTVMGICRWSSRRMMLFRRGVSGIAA